LWQVSRHDQAQYDFSLRSMRCVINLASKQLKQDLKKKADDNVSNEEGITY
jgi:hypothetical protein